MKILFIYNGAENLGIEYLSSYLKSKGHETHLLFDPAIFSGHLVFDSKLLSKLFYVDDKIVKQAIELKPDIIAFSTFTGNYRWCLSIAEKIKKISNIPIIFGGVHASAVPKEVLSNAFVDYVIVGEAEEALLELTENKLEYKDIKNLGYRDGDKIMINPPREYIKDLNALPFPDKEMFYDKVPLFQKSYLVLTSRGCPFNCTYCSNNMMHSLYCNEKNHLRIRTPKNVIEELKWAKSKFNIKLVSFVDDVFTSSKTWLEEFIPLYKSEIGIPFFCSVHPNTITKEIAHLLKLGGCWCATMGVQSASERIRKDIFNRNCSNKKMLEAISFIKQEGIIISLDNIFGAPTETEEDLLCGLKFYDEAKADRIITFWLTYYPTTKIVEIAKQNGNLTDKDIDNIYKGNVGFTHSGGSLSKDKKKIYLKYGLIFQLRSLTKNDILYKMLKILTYLPFKALMIKGIFVLSAIKNNDLKAWYQIRYLFSNKKIP